MNRFFDLLNEWCERILELQITTIDRTHFRGGIFCPACMKIHGRSGDAMFPLFYMTKRTGDPRFAVAAEELFIWSELNVARDDGSYINDPNNDWRGITAFSTVQLCECILHVDDVISADIKADIIRRIGKASKYLYHMLDVNHLTTNINYLFGCGLALELAGKVLGQEELRSRAREYIYAAVEYIDRDYLVFGEGCPVDALTYKGCRAIDIGYNVEESIPSLVQYSLSAGDECLKQTAVELMKAHMIFFLDDGGWDNSWGTRNSKWTYWGSRTSDGCQLAYAALAGEHEQFSRVACQNTRLLRECTVDGLLYGGPMYEEAGEDACIHHTICHAKALALCIAKGYVLQSEAESKVIRQHRTMAGQYRQFNNNQVIVLKNSEWYFSSSAMDNHYVPESSPSGGSISFLWNCHYGPVMAATTIRYLLYEPANMQIPKNMPTECQTFRIDLNKGGEYFSNLYDFHAQMRLSSAQAIKTVTAAGHLVNSKGRAEGNCFDFTYSVNQKSIRIEAECSSDDAVLHFPVVCSRHAVVKKINESELLISNAVAVLHIKVSGYHLNINGSANPDLSAGQLPVLFHPVGGFTYLPLSVDLAANQAAVIDLTVQEQQS